MTPAPQPPPDIPEEILAQLRRITAWLDWQRKLSRYCLIGTAVFLVLMIPGAILLENTLKHRIAPLASATREPVDWADIRRMMWEGNFGQAAEQSRELLKIQPDNPAGHHQLGLALLYRGDAVEARAAFARAVELYPISEYRDSLAAVEKRLQAESPSPAP